MWLETPGHGQRTSEPGPGRGWCRGLVEATEKDRPRKSRSGLSHRSGGAKRGEPPTGVVHAPLSRQLRRSSNALPWGSDWATTSSEGHIEGAKALRSRNAQTTALARADAPSQTCRIEFDAVSKQTLRTGTSKSEVLAAIGAERGHGRFVHRATSYLRCRGWREELVHVLARINEARCRSSREIRIAPGSEPTSRARPVRGRPGLPLQDRAQDGKTLRWWGRRHADCSSWRSERLRDRDMTTRLQRVGSPAGFDNVKVTAL